MTEKVKIMALLIGFGCMIAVAFMGLGGLIGYEKGLRKCQQEVHTDTIYVRDTISVTNLVTDTVTKIEKVKVPVPYEIHLHDTVIDSVQVWLPMEWRHASVPDTCDIYYHGIMAGIDSMRFCFTSTVINNEIVKTDWRMPKLTADIGAGALYSVNKVNPYLVGEVRYNRPKTNFSAFGAINHEGKWCAGGNVTYRINIIK